MKLRLKSAVAGAAALALAGVGLVAGAGSASAYSGTPPWVAGDTGNKGQLALYDAAGNKLTGGTDINVLAQYIQTAGPARATAFKAAVSIAFPDHLNAVPSTWFEQVLQGSTTFLPAPSGTPAVVSAGGVPFVKTALSGTLVEDNISAGTLDSFSAAYQGVFELRVRDSGPATPADGNKYWAAQIEYNPSTAGAAFDGLAPGAWRVVGGNTAGLATTTTVTATPLSGLVNNEQNVFFTANISANSGGSVAFTVDGLPFGTAKTVTAAGTYNSDSGLIAAGSHAVVATFTPSAPPTNQAGYSGSTGNIAAYVVNQITHPTTTNLTGLATVAQGSALTGNAVVTNNDTAGVVTSGTVVFTIDGTIAAGTDSTVGDGFNVSFVVPASLATGNHTLVASYSDGATFGASTSNTLTFAVTAPQYVPDVQDVSTVINPGTITISTPYHGDSGVCQIVTTFSSPNKGKLVYTGTAGHVAGTLLPPAAGGTAGQQDSHECGYLFLPAMVLNTGATQYNTSGTFDNIVVTDTRPGNNPYTLNALASDFNNAAGTGSTYTIVSTNVGFSGLTRDGGNSVDPSFGAAATNNYVTTDRPASPGIGGAGASILHATIGLGDVTMHGTLSIQAPTTTRDGIYKGTVTFSVLGT